MNGVKRIYDYHGKSVEDLQKLTTRHLLAIFESTRSKITCGCRFHCGDDVLDEHDKDWNKKQRELHARVKTILAGREHIVRDTKPEAKREKKVMAYAK